MSNIISAVYRPKLADKSPDEAEAALYEYVTRLKQIPGFLYYRILKPIAPDDAYAVLTFWQSRRHYRAAMKQYE
ncbi:MAG: antibiotic biosynthesis monooxygenase [Anaerolineales bacterium]|nr:antibiotic biosynthesis monooxygenase [Anaerolineales bacterium]